MSDNDPAKHFALFNEIGIIAQLSRALFETRLPEGVLQSHFSVLNHLIRVENGRTPLELARAFQVPKTTMTHTLAGLEKRGLVELRPNPEDGRSKRVWINGAGRAFRDEAIALLVPDMAKLAANFPQTDITSLTAQLATIREVMDKARI